MVGFIVSRVAYLILVVVTIVTLLFFLLRLAGDPSALMAGFDSSPERLEAIRHEFGFDQSLPVQYGIFFSKAVQLDFGRSYRNNEPALNAVLERVPLTLQLAVCAIFLTIVTAFPIGIIAAVRRGRTAGYLVMLLALLGQSIPGFWLAILLILLFSVQLRMLPAFGAGGPEHLILPAVTLAAFLIARQARLIRSGMLDVLGQDYMRTARAKGLADYTIVVVHGLRNMLLPIIAVIGVDVSYLIGGSVITETVFAWPGMGNLMVSSVVARDYPVVQAAVFIISIGVVAINLVVETVYRLLDPRSGLHA